MTSSTQHNSHRILNATTIVAAVILLAVVIWVSDRAIDITDEAYYILSGAHPNTITAYISAQHWALAPLWNLSGTLQHFRLVGTATLIASITLLAYGSYRVATQQALLCKTPLLIVALAAAGSIGALLYVATILPSPSYNLLASAGGYAALGLAFISATSQSRRLDVICGTLCGVALAITFINKPSASVCCALLACIAIVTLGDRRRIWVPITAGVVGGSSFLGAMVAFNWQNGAMIEHLQTGFTLFRQVQTEPIAVRLWRYCGTMVQSAILSLAWFAPALALSLRMLWAPRRWMPTAIVALALSAIVYGEHYLGGRTQYQQQIQALFALLIMTLLVTFHVWSSRRQAASLVLLLVCLPYAVAMGTGNSMFTQVIVTAGSWPLLVLLLANGRTNIPSARTTAQGLALVMMTLIVVQVLSSFGRDPYHLAQPIFAQSELTEVPVLGAVRVDLETRQMLTALEVARDNCKIAPGASFFGLYNVPGLALLINAVPPISPWITNPQQLATLFTGWKPSGRTVLALSAEAQISRGGLPDILQPIEEKYAFCGTLIVPFSNETIEIWASKLE
ncbi:hypothetical protein [Rhizobium sp. R86522]|uniref:hypothetical protein n=1 Tax=Rhizobium sp. R86522 TaxID=3093861 RepID=UPI00366BF888